MVSKSGRSNPPRDITIPGAGMIQSEIPVAMTRQQCEDMQNQEQGDRPRRRTIWYQEEWHVDHWQHDGQPESGREDDVL